LSWLTSRCFGTKIQPHHSLFWGKGRLHLASFSGKRLHLSQFWEKAPPHLSQFWEKAPPHLSLF
jgi:hypothetical protein